MTEIPKEENLDNLYLGVVAALVISLLSSFMIANAWKPATIATMLKVHHVKVDGFLLLGAKSNRNGGRKFTYVFKGGNGEIRKKSGKSFAFPTRKATGEQNPIPVTILYNPDYPHYFAAEQELASLTTSLYICIIGVVSFLSALLLVTLMRLRYLKYRKIGVHLFSSRYLSSNYWFDNREKET